MTYLPPLDPFLEKEFSLNEIKHIYLLTSYISQLMSLKQVFIKLVLTCDMIQAFEDWLEKDLICEYSYEYSNIPMVYNKNKYR